MADIKDGIKLYLKERCISGRQLSLKSGLAANYVSMLFRGLAGKNGIRVETFQKLLKGMDLSERAFWNYVKRAQQEEDGVVSTLESAPVGSTPSRQDRPKIALYGAIPAGPTVEVETEPIDWIEARPDEAGLYCMIAKGDSMLPHFQDGDRVFVEPKNITLPATKSKAKGELVPIEVVKPFHDRICVVSVDGESTFKKVVIQSTGKGRYFILLAPLNSNFNPIAVPKTATLKIHGLVVKLERYV